jgi:prepilin-type N-terminal cleavage/methylation domain-containing protein
MKTTAKGFTLIELLIVIAVLGILAVAVLSAINPIEQINRSRDTGSRSDAEQLLGAVDRFYATAGYYPWTTGADSDNTALTPLVEITDKAQLFGTDAKAVLTLLSSGGSAELKDSFVSRITATGYNNLFIYNEGAQGNSTYVCFIPVSGAFLQEAADRCAGTRGTIPPDLDSALVCGVTDGARTVDFICLP